MSITPPVIPVPFVIPVPSVIPVPFRHSCESRNPAYQDISVSVEERGERVSD
jgi:hypothetical protein